MNQPTSTATSPAPAGPYQHAVRSGNIVATAGQVGVDPATGQPAGEDIGSQTRQAIANLESALKSAGADLTTVFRVNVILVNASDVKAMNEVYAELMPKPYPARTTFYAGLNPGRIVEIDALATVLDAP